MKRFSQELNLPKLLYIHIILVRTRFKPTNHKHVAYRAQALITEPSGQTMTRLMIYRIKWPESLIIARPTVLNQFESQSQLTFYISSSSTLAWANFELKLHPSLHSFFLIHFTKLIMDVLGNLTMNMKFILS